MKKVFLTLSIVVGLLLICIVGCSEYDTKEANEANLSKTGPISIPCHPVVQNFPSLDAIQLEHKTLYDAFIAGAEEEIVFENYEIAHNNFYSLRKKDYEMTEGIIPNDPSFDPFNYTSDSVLETILNKDGMVIIAGYIYIWSDGTVIHRAPYSCANYYKLLDYSQLIQSPYASNTTIRNYKVNYDIEDLVVGLDPRYDFASLSEQGIKVDNRKETPANLQKNSCGLEAVMSHEMTAYNPVNKTVRYKISATTAAPIGLNPINTFTIPNSGQYQSVTIVNSDGYTGSWVDLYVGQWFEVEINFSNYATLNEVPKVEAYLTSIVNPISSNSCSDTYFQTFDIKCPLSLSPKMLNFTTGLYQFSIEGLDYLGVTNNYTITWSFGDGTTQVTTNSAVVNHDYDVPCYLKEYPVNAYITTNTPLCTIKFETSTTLGIGDPCKRESATWKSPSNDGIHTTINSKKVRLVQKIKKRASILGGGTVFVSKFRCRVPNTKTVYTYGPISKVVGNTCTTLNIESFITPNPKNRTGKGRLKQRFASSVLYMLDLNAPYSTKFSHTNNPNIPVLTYGLTCSQ